EEGRVTETGSLEVRLGTLGDGTRVAVVRLAIARLEHVAGQTERGLFVERIDVGRVRIGHQQHVRGFDALPAGNRRTVECVARTELVFVEMRNGHSHVLFFSAGVGETEVDELDFVFLHHLHHVCDALGCHQLSPGWMVVENLGWEFNAVSMPKLVHGTGCEARRLSPILSAFPYRS